MSRPKIYQDKTGLREQYLALRKAEEDAYDALTGFYPDIAFTEWRAAADAVNTFQQAHKEMFEYE